ncbi:hypothetical protein Q5P01_022493 [Channa striata]|uniref:Uncharacterized protein n=1 Tax=Channa striata TaxID=64152 RepID=A0AA88IXF8_CHASR|nr:hypothetical protein Q5P01_022493 [Channa striata]
MPHAALPSFRLIPQRKYRQRSCKELKLNGERSPSETPHRRNVPVPVLINVAGSGALVLENERVTGETSHVETLDLSVL